jgi:putative DNA primase/helicase
MAEAKHIVLCEGYATGLTIHAAIARLPGPNAVIVCFSARNLETVAQWFPTAVVAADNDASATGEQSALRTGLKWTMPYEVGTDFNDVHVAMGLHVVTQRMRELLFA